MALPFRNLNLANSIARLFGFRPDVPVGQRSPWKLLRRGRIGATLAHWYGPELSERKPWPEPEKLQVNRERIAVRRLPCALSSSFSPSPAAKDPQLTPLDRRGGRRPESRRPRRARASKPRGAPRSSSARQQRLPRARNRSFWIRFITS